MSKKVRDSGQRNYLNIPKCAKTGVEVTVDTKTVEIEELFFEFIKMPEFIKDKYTVQQVIKSMVRAITFQCRKSQKDSKESKESHKMAPSMVTRSM